MYQKKKMKVAEKDTSLNQADQNQLKEYFEEQLAKGKAHLPELPEPPKRRTSRSIKLTREDVVHSLEECVQELVEEHVFKHDFKIADVKESLTEKIAKVAAELKATPYETEQAKWLVYKQHMLDQADETSIYRWDNEVSKIYKISPPNTGKTVTDNNPYVNLVDVEEFDIASEVYPYADIPKTWDHGLFSKYFINMHIEATGRPDTFLPTIMRDKKRMTEEARGKVVPKVAEQKEENLIKLKEEIREYAKTQGFPAMGVTKLDRRYIAESLDDELPYDTLILLAHEMPLDDFKKIPTENSLMAFTSYRDGGENVHKVADFIRSKGHKCLTRVSSDGAIKYAPHAVNAGMGNYSTFGICIFPELGMRTKVTGIIIDAALPIDKPRDWNIEEFCARCRSCQKTCPSGAIPKDEKRFRGALKRQTYHQRCFEYMAMSYECNLCARICPFSVLGYEQSMQALPRYLHYNIYRDEVDAELLRSSWEGGAK